MREWVDRFLTHLATERRMSPHTVSAYRRDLATLLDFCGKHNVVSDIEKIDIQYVNEAYERMEKGDVRYRFVIDCASLEK